MDKTDLPIPPTHQPYPEANPAYRLERNKYRVEKGTLLLLLIYTVINYYLYRTTRNTEQVTERAYVNVQSVTLAHPLTVGQFAEAIILYKNTGLTPAKELYIVPMEDFIPNPLWAGTAPTPKHWLKCETNPQGGVLPPGVTRMINPTISINMAVGRGTVVTPKLYQRIITNETKWLAGASIRYRDQFGHCHATSEPFWYNPANKEFDAAPYGFQQVDD